MDQTSEWTSPAARPLERAWLYAVGAAVLVLAGIFRAMGGAVRWLGCFEPGSLGTACPMHDDWYSYTPGIAEPVGIGLILAGVAVLLLVSALRDRIVLVLGVVPAAGFVVAGLAELLPLGAAARAQERAEWSRLLTTFNAQPPEDGGVSLLPMIAVLTVTFLPVLAVVGWVALRVRRPDVAPGVARLRAVVAWSLVAFGLACSLLGSMLLALVSGSHDEQPGFHVMEGVVAVVAGGLILHALGRAVRGESVRAVRSQPPVALLGAAGGLLLLLGGTSWAMAGSIRWRYCWEAGPWACSATGGRGVVELEPSRYFGPVEPDTGTLLSAGAVLLLLGVILTVGALALSGQLGAATRAGLVGLAWLGAGLGLAWVNRGDDAPLVMGEVIFGVVTAALALAVLSRAGAGSPDRAGRSAGSPPRGTPELAAPGPAAR